MGKANATLSKKKSSLAKERLVSVKIDTNFTTALSYLFLLKKALTKGIVALFGDVVLLLHHQLQLRLPLDVGVLTVLDHVVY